MPSDQRDQQQDQQPADPYGYQTEVQQPKPYEPTLHSRLVARMLNSLGLPRPKGDIGFEDTRQYLPGQQAKPF